MIKHKNKLQKKKVKFFIFFGLGLIYIYRERDIHTDFIHRVFVAAAGFNS